MADEVFANVPSEGNSLDIDKAFERLEEKEQGGSPSESQPEKKEVSPAPQGDEKDSTVGEEKPLPFHKHPRWIKTQESLAQYEKRLAEYEEKIANLEKSSKTIELPQWWKDSYGDTDESKKRFTEYETATQAERDRIKQEVKEDLQREVQQEQTTSTQGEEYVETQLAEMTEEGLKFDRNSLLKFMVDFQEEFGEGSLLDKDGNYDFRKALAMKERMTPKEVDDSTSTKKALAGQASKSKASSQSSSKVPVVSRRTLNRGWREAGI